MPHSKIWNTRYKIWTGERHPRPRNAWFADPSVRASRIQQKDYSKAMPASVRNRTQARRQAFYLLLAWFGVVWICAYLATA